MKENLKLTILNHDLQSSLSSLDKVPTYKENLLNLKVRIVPIKTDLRIQNNIWRSP